MLISKALHTFGPPTQVSSSIVADYNLSEDCVGVRRVPDWQVCDPPLSFVFAPVRIEEVIVPESLFSLSQQTDGVFDNINNGLVLLKKNHSELVKSNH